MIEPRKTLKRGRVIWYVRVPTALSGKRHRRKFFDSQAQAKSYAAALTRDAGRGFNGSRFTGAASISRIFALTQSCFAQRLGGKPLPPD